jgi:hypothetical protein
MMRKQSIISYDIVTDNDDTINDFFLKNNDEYFKVLFLQFKPQTVKVSLWTCLCLSHVAVVDHGDFDLGLNAVLPGHQLIVLEGEGVCLFWFKNREQHSPVKSL